MKKNAVIQFHINPDLYSKEDKKSVLDKSNNFVFEYSKKSFENYCNKYGLEYILITEPKVNYVHPTWERLDLWINKDYWFNTYDNICYVDTDVFAMPWSSNIFSYCKENTFSRIPHLKVRKDRSPIFNNTRIADTEFQAGVIMLNKYSVEKTINDILNYKDKKFGDDAVLVNYAIANSDIIINNISESFNVKYSLNINLDTVNFLHALGKYKITNPDAFLSVLRNIFT